MNRKRGRQAVKTSVSLYPDTSARLQELAEVLHLSISAVATIAIDRMHAEEPLVRANGNAKTNHGVSDGNPEVHR